MLLAIDTSTSLIGAACLRGGEVLSEVTVADARRHGELLAPAIREALRRCGGDIGDLEQIVVGVGPGPFTGLRVGITTGLVMGHALGIPVVGVCSLDAIATQAARGVATQRGWPELLVATDARRKEVYWARYVVKA
ncbi:MAG: tRNA (adenosine(37)-N6)-threonylcarbamoyltransferase complex dimerization subunit type 1 TsaB, partial [Ornithinimicrobium sp.]